MTPEKNQSSLRIATMVAERRSQAGIRRQSSSRTSVQSRPNTDASTPGRTGGFLRVATYTTLVLCILSVALYTSAEMFGDGISRGGHSASTEKLEIVVANSVLSIPQNAIRFASQREPGEHEKIELYLHWPTLEGYSDALKEDFSNQASITNLIFVTIEPRSMSFDMSGRLEPIYSVFFEGLGIEEAHGLVRQPLSERGGYIDEDMYFEPNSPYPFAARCVREISKIGAPLCIRDIHIGDDLMITYRFHKDFLDQWLNLNSAISNYAKSLMTNQKLALAE